MDRLLFRALHRTLRFLGLKQAWRWATALIWRQVYTRFRPWEWGLRNLLPNISTAQNATASRGLVVCMSLLSEHARIDPQARSGFLSRLAPEVKRMVYDEMMPADSQLWIRAVSTGGGQEDGTAPEHFEHYPTTSSLAGALYAKNADGGGCLPGGNCFWQCIDMDGMPYVHWESMSLLSSCKRIYLDLFPLWTFSFNDLSDLEAFAACISTLGTGFPPLRTVRFAPVLPRCFCADAFHGPLEGLEEVLWGERSEPRHVPSSCQNHAEQWRDKMRRLNEVLRALRRVGLTKLILSMVPIRSGWQGFCHLTEVEEPVLLESLGLIEGVPVLVAEAPWRRLEALPRRASVDVPHPDPECRLRLRWPEVEGRSWQ